MPSPEHVNPPPLPTRTDLVTTLAVIDQQLEGADTIENPIERFYKRDQLLELHDWLQAELDLFLTPPKRC